ncbi:MAG: CbtB-domain containing protein [Gammaproteobacteria bacterium]|nr:CbtB-domain containing protein [Gammaproteobacteria bacterium]
MQNQTATGVKLHDAAILRRPLQIAAAFLLGAVILYGAGFMNAAAVHNAAHDVRHSQAFPCH